MCVMIPVTQDGVVENDIETLLVNLTSSDPAVVLTPASVPVIIFESDCKSQTNYYIDNILFLSNVPVASEA